MAVPYTFGSATSAIPLSQLDSNFASTITLGNTAIQLGNTVTTLNNMTLVNATISSGNVTVTNANVTSITATSDSYISGLTVGKGAGAVSTNTAVGASALAANTSGANNTGIGKDSLLTVISGSNNTALGSASLKLNTGSDNTGIGYLALILNNSGAYNTAIGSNALYNNTTASNNTAVGYQAGYSNSTGVSSTYIGYQVGVNATGSRNVGVGANIPGFYNAPLYATSGNDNTAIGPGAGAGISSGGNNIAIGSTTMNGPVTGGTNIAIGWGAGYSLTSGSSNTFVGSGKNGFSYGAGNAMTTGSANTIIGSYSGNQGGLDIRTASNYIVLSDGDGNPRGIFDGSGNLLVGKTSSGGQRFQVEWSVDSLATIATFKNAAATVANQYGVVVAFGGQPNNSSQYFLRCDDGNGAAERATIRSNGGLANYSANNVNLASDLRLKHNIEPVKSYWNVFRALEWKTWIYNDQTDDIKNIGVIAQELQALAPELVCESNALPTPEGEAPYLGLWENDFKMAAMSVITELVKKSEEQQALITAQQAALESLTTRLSALESK